MLKFNDYIEYKAILEDFFNDTLLTEAVHKHSTHIEEKFLIDGKKGLSQAIAGLSYIIKTIGRGDPSVSTKIDGSPAIFMSYHKENGFFVATKSIFNKEPKVNFTEEDINKNHEGGLADTLKFALKYLKDVCPNDGNLYQGDLLFNDKTLKSVKVDGEDCYAWHPNIIEYTVPKNSDIGERVSKAKIGIAVHTQYSWDGLDYKTLATSGFGVSKDIFKESPDVFLIDTVSNLNGGIGFSESEKKNLDNLIKTAISYQTKINWKMLTSDVVSYLLPFLNLYIRNNQNMPSATQREKEFKTYINGKYEEELAKRKTEKGKDAVRAKFKDVLEADGFVECFELFDLLTEIKLIILSQLNKLSLYKNFVVTKNGDYISTKDEGFVITKTSSKSCKLIDRYEFSRNNFSKDIISGFEKEN